MAGLSPEEFSRLKSSVRREKRLKENTERALIKTFSDIHPKPVEWLWPNRIAIGKLTIYAGDPGVGKSQGSLDLAARLSLGSPFPDHAPCPTGDSLILTNEDDPEDTIRPRLDALGADVSRIHYLKSRIVRDSAATVTLWDRETFLDAVDQIRGMGRDFRLLIIDPLEGFLGGSDANKNGNVRETLAGLLSLAGEERFSVLAIQHLNKAASPAAYRVGGSIAFTALARSVWIFIKDKRTPDRRLFLPLKNNLGADKSGFEYALEAIGPSSRIRWGEEAEDDLDSLMAAFNLPAKPVSPEREALLKLLRERSPESLGTGELAKALGKKEPAVTNLLVRLKQSGLVHNPAYGRWTVSQLSPNLPVLLFGGSDETGPAGTASPANDTRKTGENGESDGQEKTATGRERRAAP
jgi:DNA-binding transcriptional ArsR family regulator